MAVRKKATWKQLQAKQLRKIMIHGGGSYYPADTVYVKPDDLDKARELLASEFRPDVDMFIAEQGRGAQLNERGDIRLPKRDKFRSITLSKELLEDQTPAEIQQMLRRVHDSAAERNWDEFWEKFGPVIYHYNTAEEHTAMQPVQNEVSTADINHFMEQDGLNIIRMLIQKNTQYDSAILRPVHVLSTSDNLEQVKVRIDDKIKRLQNWFQQRENSETVESIFQNEDTIADLIGYLLILRAVARFKFGKESVDCEPQQYQQAAELAVSTTEKDEIRSIREALRVREQQLNEREAAIAQSLLQLQRKAKRVKTTQRRRRS